MTINSIQNSISTISSGKRINSAADDAAGLAISQSLQSQSKGLEKASDNGLAFKDLANTADSALSSISDSLQRMRELGVQASNGTSTGSDRQAMQIEVNQLKQSIGDAVKNTQFNTQKILDGTFVDKKIAINPQGTGSKMNIQDTGLATLGVQNFDVTGNIDLKAIDDAIKKISDARGNLGATTNVINSAVNTNNITQSSTEAADSKSGDTDIPSAISKLKVQQDQDQIKIYAQKKTMASMASSLSLLA